MKRGIGLALTGAGLYIVGRLLSELALNLIVIDNPSHSSLIKDANYHMIAWSNNLLFLSHVGIAVLVLGGFVFFYDRKKRKIEKN